MNQLLIQIKSNFHSDKYTPQQMIEALFNEFNGPKSKLTATIKGLLLSSLGLLSDLYPTAFTNPIDYSKRLAESYGRELGAEFESKNDPNAQVIEGCFVGLRYFLNNFNECFTHNNK